MILEGNIRLYEMTSCTKISQTPGRCLTELVVLTMEKNIPHYSVRDILY